MTSKKPVPVKNMFASVRQSQEVNGLKDRVEELEAEIDRLRAAQSTNVSDNVSERKAELEQRIEELTTQLADRSGVHEISIDLIQLDPNQPRTIYPDSVIRERAESLRREGQLSPVILIPVDSEKYRLFDGHLRRIAAPLAGMTTLNAVLRKDIDPVETFDQQLTTSIQSEKLHDLDLAIGLVKLISHRTELSIVEIPSVTNSALQKLKRAGNVSELKLLRSANREDQENWLQSQDLDDVQRHVLQIILGKGLNPASINSNIFPLLKLPDDVQDVMKQGLEASKAKEIAKMTAEKLQTSKTWATKLRKKLALEALNEQFSLSELKSRVRKIIKELTMRANDNGSYNPKSVRPVSKIIQHIQELDTLLGSVEINPIQDKDDLKSLEETLQAQLRQVQQLLGEAQ